MPSRLTASALLAFVAAGVLFFVSPPLAAQWFKYPTADVPRSVHRDTPTCPDTRWVSSP